MNRWVVVLATLTFSISLTSNTKPLPAAAGFVFEGKVADLDGRPIHGAEIQLLDDSGKVKGHTFSDLAGNYLFSAILALSDEAGSYRIEISHLRYQPVRLKRVMRGARIDSPEAADLALTSGRPATLLAATRLVCRDFVLAPSRGTPQHPALGPLDPNYPEYCYGHGRLLLSQNRDREAIELLKIYAQTGTNPREIAECLKLLAEHDK